MSTHARLLEPDEVLLRRFGWVRAAGGAAYIVGVLALLPLIGPRIWPAALGVPVLAVVTTAYFVKSSEYPRAAVAGSLVADALVLGGVIATLKGAGSGLVLLYAIVVVSAGLLLGPGAAVAFTVVTVGLGLMQLLAEQMPAERLPVFLVSLAGLVSVGVLSATYAARLHELIVDAGVAAEAVRVRGRRRRDLLGKAAHDAGTSLRAVEEVADRLDEPLADDERRRLSGQLRIRVAELDAEMSQLADVGSLDETGEQRPEPILLRETIDDCVIGLGERLEGHIVQVDVPPLRVLGHRRAARRIVFNLLENVVEHTPSGTRVQVSALRTGPRGVLVVTDDGPGIAPDVAAHMFDGSARVGLPLVRQLCESMGAEVRYEIAPNGGARFLVGFRLAPGGGADA